MARRIRWIVVAAFATAAAVGAAFLLQGFGARGPEGRGPSAPSRNVGTVAPPALAAAERAGPSEAGEASGESADTPAAPEGAAPASAGVWRGRVLNSAGAGLASAEVGIVDGMDHAHVRAVDADGTFAWPYDELPADPRTVFARCDGFVTSPSHPLRLRDIGSFVLEAGVRIAGRVVAAETGAPIVGAAVHVEDDSDLEPERPRVYGDVVTDARGELSAITVTPRRHVVVRAAAEGFGAREIRLRVVDPQVLELRLDPEGRIRGVVVGEDGRPKPRLHVVAVTDDADRSVFAEAESGADGEFELRGLPRGVSLLVTDAPYWSVASPSDSYRSGSIAVRVAVAGPVVLDDRTPEAVVRLVVTEPASLRVTVLDPDGRRVSGGRVSLGHDKWAPLAYVVDGVAVFASVCEAKFGLMVDIEGYPRVIEPVETVWGQRCERTITLPRVVPATLGGVVVDEAGRPVAGVEVSASDATGRRWVHAKTDAEGKFRLDGVAAGSNRLVADARGYYFDGGRSGTSVVAPADDVRIVARALLSVRGHVVPPAGRTLGTFWVSADSDSERLPEIAASMADVRWAVSPGTWTFTVGGVRGCCKLARTVTVVAGRSVDLGDLPLEEGAVLEGVVVGASGAPIAGATVSVGEELGVAAPDGSFRVEGIPPGPMRVRAGAEGYAFTDIPVDLVASKGPLRIVLEHGGRLRVTPRVAGARRHDDGWEWRAVPTGARDPAARGADGEIRRPCIERLHSGRYLLEAWRTDNGSETSAVPEVSIPFEIEDGKETEVEVTFPAR